MAPTRNLAPESALSLPVTDPHAAAKPAADPARGALLFDALGLSLGMGIALGLARFAYALLLPPMKADLGWSFAQAGTVNTVNAVGYLLGALLCPWVLRRCRALPVFCWSCAATALLMALPGLSVSTLVLLAQRLSCGVGSALIVVGGGMLAARLAAHRPVQGGLLLGIYYGGAGWGVMLSAVLVPASLGRHAHGWQPAWLALALGCAAFAVIAIRSAGKIEARPLPDAAHRAGGPGASTQAPSPGVAPALPQAWYRYGWALAAYGLFGVGYVGYMTFVIALLGKLGMSAAVITGFYLLLGAAVVVSARLWARLLDHARGGAALALLNLLLAVATLLPALSTHPLAAFVSGALFGATFLSLVTSTTAFVRHNLPPAQWAGGISAFTVVFAIGQIVGPVAIGHVSDGAGLTRGFIYSGAVLCAAAALAIVQRPLGRGQTTVEV
jgi:predicted MFS family arabinose efflux permease